METSLQSNEIKIPKSNNKVHPSKIDFKSSFARSLTVGNGCDENRSEASKSLDFEINFQACNGAESENASCDKSAVKLSAFDDNLVAGNFTESFNKSDEDKERQLWSKKQHQQIPNENCNSSDAEILRLRKECQNLIEENRRLQAKHPPPKMSSLPYGSLQFECNNGVENVVLQTKVETLQWQLRQVENSRQMYRCIMEEVARYLEKCHFNFEMIQKRERDKVIERSKSIAYIAKSKTLNGVAESDGRARSSSNLTSLNTLPQKQSKSGTLLGDISYSAFKDFTWRRTPKNKSNGVEVKPEKFTFCSEEITATVATFDNRRSPNKDNEIDVDKLSKEAFRLSRTVQNFLNTHEPILSQAISAPEPTVFPRSTLEQQRNDFLFSFDRESHLSLRSTDESSVHSSSNSSNSNKEEDESTVLPNLPTSKTSCIPAKVLTKSKRFSTCHQTEDESGFSSMNSFHEIGLPLHSTMISVNTSGSSFDESQSETVIKSNNKKPAAELRDEVGVPLVSPTKLITNHRRYESAPVSLTQSSKMKILENDEKTMKVLWV